MQDYTRAIELDPGCDIAYHNRGVCYRMMGLYREADADYSRGCQCHL